MREQSADWRAVCGKSARTVRREGRRSNAASLPLSWHLRHDSGFPAAGFELARSFHCGCIHSKPGSISPDQLKLNRQHWASRCSATARKSPFHSHRSPPAEGPGSEKVRREVGPISRELPAARAERIWRVSSETQVLKGDEASVDGEKAGGAAAGWIWGGGDEDAPGSGFLRRGGNEEGESLEREVAEEGKELRALFVSVLKLPPWSRVPGGARFAGCPGYHPDQ